MFYVYLDTETRARVPIAHGTDRYTANCECMIVTWARDDEPVKLWDRMRNPTMPPELLALCRDPDAIFVSHNASFDWRVMLRALGLHVPIHRWRCTMAQAYSHGLPGSLEALGIVLGLPESQRKMSDAGDKLIPLFCEPKREHPNGDVEWNDYRTHPEKWDEFCTYAIRDTDTGRHIHKALPSHNYQGENLRAYWLDQLINERGFGFDDQLAIAARTLLSKAKLRQDIETVNATNGAVQSATQRGKMLQWFRDRALAIPDMKAATIRQMLESDDIDPVTRFMLELRMEASKSSGAKYGRGLTLVGDDMRMRNTLQFGGAGRTGRWSGRGFQPHNMQRPTTNHIEKDGRIVKMAVKWGFINDVIIPGIKTGKVLDYPELYGGPNEACANALRGAIVAQGDNVLTAVDWSNIESRVLAWIAGEVVTLDDYRNGVDLYKRLAGQMFGIAPELVNDQQRQSAKVVILACGYLGGVGAFVAMAAGYDMDLDTLPPLVLPGADAEMLKKARKAWRRAFLTGDDFGLEPDTYMACDILKQSYRKANEHSYKLGAKINDATLNAVKNPNTMFEVAKCRIWSTGRWLIIQLPSGRRLLYANPELRVKHDKDIETGAVRTSEYLTYMTARGKSWSREKAWPGLFIENIVQAIALDILRAGLLNIHDYCRTEPRIAAYLATLPAEARTAICLHVHDEAVTDLPKGLMTVEKQIELMTTGLLEKYPWMRGLPLAAEGWQGPRYHK